MRDDVLKMIATNVRHPRDFQGDLAAMIGSARVGERRLLALLDEYGAPIVGPAIDAILDGAERQARACIAAWKDGVYRGEAVLDDDGHGFRDIYIRAKVTKRGSDLTVDLTDSHPQVTGFVNSSYPNMRSAVAMALAYLIDPETPKNDGTFRPLTVIAKAGTVVWANPPAPLTLCTNHCAQEIAESVIKALAPACPTRVLAGWGRRFRIAIQGMDPRSGRPFIWHMFHARPGGGASPAGDGWPTAGEGQAAGGIKFGSVEVTEVRFPLLLRAARVPAGLGRRRAVPRRSRVHPRAPRGDRRAGAGEHRRRRHPSRAVRDPRRAGRPAASLPACAPAAGATGCSGRRRSASSSGRATSSWSSRAAAAATATRASGRPRPAPTTARTAS